MLYRSSHIHHRGTGVTLPTPLLIPSFSSKGFAYSRKDGKSEIGNILVAAGEFLTEAYLLSAYDVHYGHVPGPNELPFVPDIVFLDSGGYEVSTDRDYSSVIDPLPAPEKWDIGHLLSVWDRWPDEVPALFVSYDRGGISFQEQAEFANQTFSGREQHLRLMLLKPSQEHDRTLHTTITEACDAIGELAAFDVVGVTEKELGRSMLERMVQIAKLRMAMDKATVAAPIHVFGALDPLSACLYFLAGAEIFDGLTWIRYGYDNSWCVYLHNLGVLKHGLEADDDFIKLNTLSSNYYALRAIQRKLLEFCKTGDFHSLEPHGQFLESAHQLLSKHIREGK